MSCVWLRRAKTVSASSSALFDERQSHDINQQYMIDGLGSDLEVTGWPNTLWLTQADPRRRRQGTCSAR